MPKEMGSPDVDRVRRPRIRSHYRFQWEPAQKAYVLLYPEGMVRLNGSAGEVLAHCNGEHPVKDIIDLLSAKFPEADGIEADILEFLRDAEQQGWVSYE